MKNLYIFTVICAVIWCGCHTKEEQKESGANDNTSQNETEIKSADKAFNDQFIDGKPIYSYLKLSNIDQNVLAYYQGYFTIKQNDSTKALLETLNTENERLFPFYYRCFLAICKEADSTMSTFIGPHAIRMVNDHTEYIMKKLNTSSPDYFTGLISNYIYQNKDWENEVNQLSIRLHNNLEHSSTKLRKELDLFIVGIKNDIEHIMNTDQ